MTAQDSARIGLCIRGRAAELGFDQVGFCGADPPAETAHFERWIERGMHAGMSWLERGRAKRLDPRLVLESARSFVVVTLDYGRSPAPPPLPAREREEAGAGVVSRYADGDDYHQVLGRRLASLEQFIETLAPGHSALAYVDTGPVLERMWAARAGIGWVGKNSLILNKEHGSYFFLGVIVTSLALVPDAPALDQCGSCTRCIEACPTGAIVEPRLVDSRRCIAYHTIELRGAVAGQHREAIGARIFGCDDCQDACPWNDAALKPARSPAARLPSLLEILTMTHAAYLERFRGSAIRRATHQGLRRNAALALGNTGSDEATLESLERVAGDTTEDPVVREQARWSVSKVRARLEAARPR